MKHAIVGSLTALLAGAGLALAQTDEVLPRPRAASATATPGEAGTDQITFPPGTVPPGPPGDTAGYGPPPSFMAPVCPQGGTPFRFWTEGDYHMWWFKKENFPALLESLPAGGGAPAILVGGDGLDRTQHNGGGLTLGGWCTDYQGFGIEGSFFVMESTNKSFGFAGSGLPGSATLVRPFTDVLSGQTAVLPISSPGLFSGSAIGTTAGVQCDSGRFFGADIHMLGNICCDAFGRWDFLIGYRYLSLDDRFSMESTSTAVSPLVSPNGQALTSVLDRINTGNRFNGADFGLKWQYYFFDALSVRATARIAFGASDEGATLAGETSTLSFPTRLNPNGVPMTFGSGFLARPSNPGTHTDQFAVVPEADLSLVYNLCDWMRLSVGYTFLYWSNVARSGGQVDTNINRLEVPALTPPIGVTVLPPLAQIHCTNFWAQGFNVGLEFRY